MKEELDLADDSTKVFKLIGPALVTQDLSEAKGNVQKRIEYIRSGVRQLQIYNQQAGMINALINIQL